MKILSYLKGTRSLGITYVRGSGLSLNVYADADYASKENDRRSVSGIAVTLGGTVVSHTSKTQRIVSLSTSEVEYIAAGEGVKEALFVRAVLSFIAPETSEASIKVLEDNQRTKALIENPLSSARSKHIDVRYHFIRDLFRTRKNYVEYVASAEQYADILTKALIFIFPVQLTTSRIGNLTRLIHTLLYVMTIHTYIHTSVGQISCIIVSI